MRNKIFLVKLKEYPIPRMKNSQEDEKQATHNQDSSSQTRPVSQLTLQHNISQESSYKPAPVIPPMRNIKKN